MEKKMLLLLIVCFSSNASTYIDPGTGASIIGNLGPLIIGLFATIGAFLVKTFWTPIKGLFSKKK